MEQFYPSRKEILSDNLLKQFILAITSEVSTSTEEITNRKKRRRREEKDNENNNEKNLRDLSNKEINKVKELDEKIINRYIESISELQRIGFIRITSTGHQIRKLMVTWVT